MVQITVNGIAYSLMSGRALDYGAVVKLARMGESSVFGLLVVPKDVTVSYEHASGTKGTLREGGPKIMATEGLVIDVRVGH